MKKLIGLFMSLATCALLLVPVFAQGSSHTVTAEDVMDNINLGYKVEYVRVSDLGDESAEVSINRQLEESARDSMLLAISQSNVMTYSDSRATGEYHQSVTRQTKDLISVKTSRDFSVGEHKIYSDKSGQVFDAQTGAKLRLSELFNNSSDYLKIVKNDMKTLVNQPLDVDDECSFYLTDTELVLVCKQGEEDSQDLRAYEVPIALTDLQDVLKPQYR